MKVICPYCGHETEGDRPCEKCSAYVPPKEEPPKKRRQKELNEHGT